MRKTLRDTTNGELLTEYKIAIQMKTVFTIIRGPENRIMYITGLEAKNIRKPKFALKSIENELKKRLPHWRN